MRDSRPTGEAAEAILVSLLSQYEGVHAVGFDTVSLDIITFDRDNVLFKGNGPFFIQSKLRMSNHATYTSQGHSVESVEKVKATAIELGIDLNNVYYAIGFAKNSDIRTVEFFLISVSDMELFRGKGSQYRFTYAVCKEYAEVSSPERFNIIHL